jgi:hypothetical protein
MELLTLAVSRVGNDGVMAGGGVVERWQWQQWRGGEAARWRGGALAGVDKWIRRGGGAGGGGGGAVAAVDTWHGGGGGAAAVET